MPNIKSRTVCDDSLMKYQPVTNTPTQTDTRAITPGDPTTISMTGTQTRLMSPNLGNRVPMRGIHPIELMSDNDLYHFFPNTAFMDRIPVFTYYALNNQAK